MMSFPSAITLPRLYVTGRLYGGGAGEPSIRVPSSDDRGLVQKPQLPVDLCSGVPHR